MSDKAILIVSFGTSHLDTMNKTIKVIEDTIKNKYKAYTVYSAFTSKMIINKLKKENNISIDTVSDAMEKIIKSGASSLRVLPTHIINGIENDRMIEDVEQFCKYFESIEFAKPLLSSPDDYLKVIDIITSEYKIDDSEALVLMGHGTQHFINAAYPALDYTFKTNGYKNIFVGTVEGYPKIEDIISLVSEYNPQKVKLLPLMLVAGDHAKNDMAGDKSSWKTAFLDAGIEVECIIKGLGELEGIRKLYTEHLNAVL